MGKAGWAPGRRTEYLWRADTRRKRAGPLRVAHKHLHFLGHSCDGSDSSCGGSCGGDCCDALRLQARRHQRRGRAVLCRGGFGDYLQLLMAGGC